MLQQSRLQISGETGCCSGKHYRARVRVQHFVDEVWKGRTYVAIEKGRREAGRNIVIILATNGKACVAKVGIGGAAWQQVRTY